MKTKNMLWMSALLALLAGCSQGELGTDDTPGKGVGKEIRLVFSRRNTPAPSLPKVRTR